MFKDTGRCTFIARINYVGGEIVEHDRYIYIFLIVLENEPPVGLDSIHVLSLSSRLYVIKCVESFETCYALKFTFLYLAE